MDFDQILPVIVNLLSPKNQQNTSPNFSNIFSQLNNLTKQENSPNKNFGEFDNTYKNENLSRFFENIKNEPEFSTKKPDERDSFWQLPKYDVLENNNYKNSSDNFQNKFIQQTNTKNNEENFNKAQNNDINLETILSVLNILSKIFSKNVKTEEKEKEEIPSFISTLRRCD